MYHDLALQGSVYTPQQVPGPKVVGKTETKDKTKKWLDCLFVVFILCNCDDGMELIVIWLLWVILSEMLFSKCQIEKLNDIE